MAILDEKKKKKKPPYSALSLWNCTVYILPHKAASPLSLDPCPRGQKRGGVIGNVGMHYAGGDHYCI